MEGRVSESERKRIEAEVLAALDRLIAGCESLDMDAAFGPFSRSSGVRMIAADGSLRLPRDFPGTVDEEPRPSEREPPPRAREDDARDARRDPRAPRREASGPRKNDGARQQGERAEAAETDRELKEAIGPDLGEQNEHRLLGDQVSGGDEEGH